MGINNTCDAMSTLKHKAACKLYIWFALNQDEYTFALSQKKACADLKMDKKTYQGGINELIEKGYLIQSPLQKNLYIFHDSQQITLIRGGKITPTGKDENIPKNQVENSNQEQISPMCGEEIPPTCGVEILATGEGESPPEISQYNTVNNISNNNYIYTSSIEEYKSLPEEKEYSNSEIEEPITENIKDSDTDLSVEESLPKKKEDRTYIDFTVEDENEIAKTISMLESIEKRLFTLPPDENEILTYLKNQKDIHEKAEKNPDEWERKCIYMFAKPCIILAQKNSYAEPQELPKEAEPQKIPKEVDKFTEITEDDDLPF